MAKKGQNTSEPTAVVSPPGGASPTIPPTTPPAEPASPPVTVQTVSTDDFKKYQSTMDSKLDALSKELALAQQASEEKDRRLEELEAQDMALRSFMSSQEGDTRTRLETDLQSARQQATSQRQVVEAARILKARELVSQDGSLIKLDELLNQNFHSPEEMEMYFIRTNAERQIAKLRSDLTETAPVPPATPKTEGEPGGASERVGVPGSPAIPGQPPSPADYRDIRKRGRRGSVRFLEDSWQQLSGQASKTAKI